jgi:uncharacterized protein (UPF0332 family)
MSSPADNLANLARTGLLRAEAPSKQEAQGYLTHAATCLKDSKIPQNSALTRFGLSYGAGFALALAVLRAHGYRPAKGTPGHRAIVFQTLAHTVGADPAVWRSLQAAHDKRNKSEYEGMVEVSEREAADLLATVEKLDTLVRAKIAATWPDPT